MAETILVNEISDIGEYLPEGRYIGRLDSAEGAESKAKNPMVVARFVATQGAHEGEETSVWYVLKVSEGKNGKKYCRAVTDIKRLFAAIGKPLAPNFAFPLDPHQAAALLGRTLKGVDLDIRVSTEVDKEDPEKKRTRTTIVGPAAKPASQFATTAPASKYDVDEE